MFLKWCISLCLSRRAFPSTFLWRILLQTFILGLLAETTFSYSLENKFDPEKHILTDGFVYQNQQVRMIIPKEWFYLNPDDPSEAILKFQSGDGYVLGILYKRKNPFGKMPIHAMFQDLLSNADPLEKHLWYSKKSFYNQGYLAKHQFRNLTYIYRGLYFDTTSIDAEPEYVYYLKIGQRRAAQTDEILENKLETQILQIFYSLMIDTKEEKVYRSLYQIRIEAPKPWSIIAGERDEIAHLYNESIKTLITMRHIDRIREGEDASVRVKDLINRFKARFVSKNLEYLAEMVQITAQKVEAVHFKIERLQSSNSIPLVMEKYFFIHRNRIFEVSVTHGEIFPEIQSPEKGDLTDVNAVIDTVINEVGASVTPNPLEPLETEGMTESASEESIGAIESSEATPENITDPSKTLTAEEMILQILNEYIFLY